jgi:hypothetical protein
LPARPRVLGRRQRRTMGVGCGGRPLAGRSVVRWPSQIPPAEKAFATACVWRGRDAPSLGRLTQPVRAIAKLAGLGVARHCPLRKSHWHDGARPTSILGPCCRLHPRPAPCRRSLRLEDLARQAIAACAVSVVCAAIPSSARRGSRDREPGPQRDDPPPRGGLRIRCCTGGAGEATSSKKRRSFACLCAANAVLTYATHHLTKSDVT